MLELGAILWFPCILWNCNNPEKLWALNPKKLLLPDAQMGHINETEVTLRDRSQDNVSKNDCWICYDPSHDSDLINPCKCKVRNRIQFGKLKQINALPVRGLDW